MLRLVLELKQTGQPMLLVLNMIDIAQRQGIDIDPLEALSRELGVPVTTTVAVRKRGIEELVDLIDRTIDHPAQARLLQQEPAAKDIRIAHREVERVLKTRRAAPARPDTRGPPNWTAFCCTRCGAY